MEPLVPIVFVIVIILIAVLSMSFRSSRSGSMLEQWAQDNEVTLLSQDYRTFFKGPYFWTSTKGQMIFYVTVQDRHARIRHAWVRCGGYWMGMLSDHIDVVWED
jgi:hypothetical protein